METTEPRTLALRRAHPDELAELVVTLGSGASMVFVLRDSLVRYLAVEAVQMALHSSINDPL